jgi:peptidoglycan/LPS O-acetylase OafA/YrhL
VLGPLVTDRSATGYLGSTEPVRYVVDSVAAVVSAGTVADIPYELPGVFAENPHQAVNGSLWTLPIEVRAYYLLALLGVAGLMGRGLPVVAGGGLAALAAMALGDAWEPARTLVEPVAAQRETLLLLTLFAASALLYVQRARIPVRPGLACTGLAAWLVLSWTSLSAPATVLLLPYVVLVTAYRAPAALRRITARGDVSYGVYLFAFPVQQVIVLLLGWRIGPWALVALSFPAVYLLAYLSWRTVESPALRLKHRLPFSRTYAIGQDGVRRPHPQST